MKQTIGDHLNQTGMKFSLSHTPRMKPKLKQSGYNLPDLALAFEDGS
jgi:hypothetical protein